MTKFERAKKQTIKKMDRILLLLIDGKPAQKAFGMPCGFCDAHRNVLLIHQCRDCPIYKKERWPCYRKNWYIATRNSFPVPFSDEAIPRILAIKMYVEELEEE